MLKSERVIRACFSFPSTRFRYIDFFFSNGNNGELQQKTAHLNKKKMELKLNLFLPIRCSAQRTFALVAG